MAMIKLRGRLEKRKTLEVASAQRYEMKICMAKMTGMTASSTSLSAVSWDASLVKTGNQLAKMTDPKQESSYLDMA